MRPLSGRGPRPPAEVRIVAGHWRRTPLAVADKPGLRPTPERLRTTLFNWLGDLSGQTLVDAFAGSGALGLEAASRGAAEVTLLERDPALVLRLNKTLQRLQAIPGTRVSVCRTDALTWSPPRAVDGVFLDPPFDDNLFARSLTQASRWLKPGGWVYLESPAPWDDWPEGVRPVRQTRVGAVYGQLALREAVTG